ncbi:MAG TPA: SulP family inorganic anion transporter [Solirubrobacteraceae bacterium]|nr:SulP family inorganic anion transporter [Solirubrobacteraceae bacterium]
MRGRGPDLVAGVVAACVVVPQAIAYAALAGLPVQVGLYAALVPMLVYAALGSSRALSVSVTSTIAIITATAVSGSDDPAATAVLLAIMAGGLLLIAGVIRLGFLADLISLPILSGYKAGIGLVILSSQLGKVLGVPVDGDGFFGNVADLVRGLDAVDGASLALGGATIALLLVLPRVVPAVPAPLVAVALGVAAVALLDPDVDVVGAVPAGLPGFDLPDFSGWRALVTVAGGVALMAAVESLAAARALARRDDPKVDANQELRALGAASVAGGLFQAMPSSGGLSQSAVQDGAGARSQLASVACAAVVVLVLTVLTGLLEDLAQATLGALVVVAAAGLVKVGELRMIARVRTRDFALALVAFAGVLVLGVLDGILVAVFVSIAVLLHEANRPPVDVIHEEAGVMVMRPRGRLHFANVRRTNERVVATLEASDPRPRIVILDVVAVPDLEITAVAAMHDLADDLRAHGAELWIASLTPAERRMVERFEAEDELPLFETPRDAVRVARG